MKTIDLVPVSTEQLSPKDFLKVMKKEAHNIESAEVQPPRLGGKSFGSILIKRRVPVFRTSR